MKTGQPDPALTLATRIYDYREKGEAWTTAVDRYARDVLFRHPRTVHRWLAGESPIPAVVANRLKDRPSRMDTDASGELVILSTEQTADFRP